MASNIVSVKDFSATDGEVIRVKWNVGGMPFYENLLANGFSDTEIVKAVEEINDFYAEIIADYIEHPQIGGMPTGAKPPENHTITIFERYRSMTPKARLIAYLASQRVRFSRVGTLEGAALAAAIAGGGVAILAFAAPTALGGMCATGLFSTLSNAMSCNAVGNMMLKAAATAGAGWFYQCSFREKQLADLEVEEAKGGYAMAEMEGDLQAEKAYVVNFIDEYERKTAEALAEHAKKMAGLAKSGVKAIGMVYAQDEARKRRVVAEGFALAKTVAVGAAGLSTGTLGLGTVVAGVGAQSVDALYHLAREDRRDLLGSLSSLGLAMGIKEDDIDGILLMADHGNWDEVKRKFIEKAPGVKSAPEPDRRMFMGALMDIQGKAAALRAGPGKAEPVGEEGGGGGGGGGAPNARALVVRGAPGAAVAGREAGAMALFAQGARDKAAANAAARAAEVAAAKKKVDDRQAAVAQRAAEAEAAAAARMQAARVKREKEEADRKKLGLQKGGVPDGEADDAEKYGAILLLTGVSSDVADLVVAKLKGSTASGGKRKTTTRRSRKNKLRGKSMRRR